MLLPTSAPRQAMERDLSLCGRLARRAAVFEPAAGQMVLLIRIRDQDRRDCSPAGHMQSWFSHSHNARTVHEPETFDVDASSASAAFPEQPTPMLELQAACSKEVHS